MREKVNELSKGFPEDDFDLEKFRRQTLARKDRTRRDKVSVRMNKDFKNTDPKNVAAELADPAALKDSASDTDDELFAWDDPETLFMSDFDLDEIRKKVITRKRVRFWKRNSKLFVIISLLSLIAMFVLAYFAFHFLMDIILNYTLLR